jgi:hypothetical protein
MAELGIRTFPMVYGDRRRGLLGDLSAFSAEMAMAASDEWSVNNQPEEVR